MSFHKKAALILIICAVPFMFLASWFWVGGQKPSVYSDTLYNMGDAIFQLGFPLTTVFYSFLLNLFGGKFGKENDFWVLPLINFVFVIQWIIWSQLVVLIYKKFKKLK